ncbi:MAG TPA: quinone-dependent dihydroorotate dehydrogenase [Verrucomicrobiae bacterium]|jgi:dihydroorotate dehydrogenase|nr:quinone-dependent dihydroorotate dehydrogenase [Verrucomicrobiae bacterium]
MSCYRALLRPLLFFQDSEKIHNRTLGALAWASRHEVVCNSLAKVFGGEELPVTAFGLNFPNPVGLAAGMDKQAAAVPVWESFGFGFSELGGVTWHAQPGNPAPRMFRAVADEALINRMGFNNPGAAAMAERLERWHRAGRWPKHPVGINLGKSKVTPLGEAAKDYSESLKLLWPHADFFVVNVSSPNTPGLRQLQDRVALDEIFAALQETNDSLARTSVGNISPKPILVKVAPDLSFEALDEILELTGPRRIAGIVATNTTIARPASQHEALKKIYAQEGGLSGRPLAARSTEVVRHIYRQTGGKLPIIGVGGIFNASDAWEKITAGAALVQVYTGLVYEGPGIAKRIVTGLRERLKAEGMTILQAVGRNSH